MSKKIWAIFLIAVIAFSFVSCSNNGPKVNHNFTVDDVIDASPSQQKWLRKPDSIVVINPDAIDSDSYNNIDGKLSLTVGITDESGNINKKLSDVLFVLEPTYANALGGEEVWSCKWDDTDNVLFIKRTDPHATASYDYKNATFDVSTWADTEAFDENGNLMAWASYSGETAEFQLTFYSHYFFMANYGVPYNSEKQYYLIIDCEVSDKDVQYPKVWAVRGYYDHKVTEISSNYLAKGGDYCDLVEDAKHRLGFFYININEIASSFGGKKATEYVYPTLFLEREGVFKFNKFAIREVDPEVKYGDASTTSHQWAPYYMSSTTMYPNGTVVKMQDVISGKNSVCRMMECVSPGVVEYAGYLNGGTPTYEKVSSSSSAMTVKGSDFEYCLFFNYYGKVTYYDSETDLLNKENGSEEPKASSQYFLLEVSRIGLETKKNFGFAFSQTGEDVKAIAKSVASNNFYVHYEEEVISYWNEYIKNNDASPYILNIPQDD